MALFKFNNIKIEGICTSLPLNRNNENIQSKKHYATEEQTTSDLGFTAAEIILANREINREEIGCLLFASTTPDYRSPITAAVLQNRLGLSHDIVAYDIAAGGTGFIYALKNACAILETISKKYALVITGDTISKQFSKEYECPGNVFDSASAILLEKTKNAKPIYVSEHSAGFGYDAIQHKTGGFRLNEEQIKMPERAHENKALINNLSVNTNEFENYVKQTHKSIITGFLEETKQRINSFDYIIINPWIDNIINDLLRNDGISESYFLQKPSEYGFATGNFIPYLINSKINAKAKNCFNILAYSAGEGLSSGVVSFFIETENIYEINYTNDYYTDGKVSHSFD